MAAIEWGTLAINVGLSLLSFLTVFLFNNIYNTVKENARRIAALTTDLAIHLERHKHCKCNRDSVGGDLDYEDHDFN